MNAFCQRTTATLNIREDILLRHRFLTHRPATMNIHSNRFTAVRQILLAVILIAGPLFAIAQSTIAIAPTKLNVLYIGVDNPVSVAASGGTDDNITVSVNGGGCTITKTGTGLYNVQVTEVTNECVLSIYINGKLEGSSNFRVRRLPAPFGTVGGLPVG